MENKDVYELTNPQKSIWLTEQFYAGSTVNNICGTANINNKIDFNQLEKAINIVIKNNSSFLMWGVMQTKVSSRNERSFAKFTRPKKRRGRPSFLKSRRSSRQLG